MDLKTIFKGLAQACSSLGDYTKYSIEELMDNYCSAIDMAEEAVLRDENAEKDEVTKLKPIIRVLDSGKLSQARMLKNIYLSAVILRFWKKVGDLYESSKSLGISREDAYSMLIESINYAAKYRKWQSEGENGKKAPNATTCINQCCNTIRLQHFYDANLDINAANYNQMSLDVPSDDRECTTWKDSVEDDSIEAPDTGSAANALVQSCINKHKIVEAIILETIATRNTEKVSKTKEVVKFEHRDTVRDFTVDRTTSEFWAFKCIQELNNLDPDFATYFAAKYNIAQEELDLALDTVRKAPNKKKYKFLERTLDSMRTDSIRETLLN